MANHCVESDAEDPRRSRRTIGETAIGLAYRWWWGFDGGRSKLTSQNHLHYANNLARFQGYVVVFPIQKGSIDWTPWGEIFLILTILAAKKRVWRPDTPIWGPNL